MAMTDEQRLELYEVLKERIGARPANTLMAAIPPVGWADVATKRDLDVLGAALRQEMAAMEATLRHEVAISVADLRTELHRECGLIRTSMADLQRTLFFSLLGAQATFAGLLAGVIIAVD